MSMRFADQTLETKLVVATFLGTVLTLVSYFAGIYYEWISEVNWLEVAAVWTSYVCTILCTAQSRWNYPIGVVTTALYSFLFWQWNAPALALFNLYLVFSLAYGWFRWKDDANTRPVTRINGVWWFGYAALGVGVLGLLLFILEVLGASMTTIDITLAVLSGVAQFMLDNKKLENWWVWAVVNVLSIWYFMTAEAPLFLAAFQYLFFLGNTVWGYVEWKKTMIA